MESPKNDEKINVKPKTEEAKAPASADKAEGKPEPPKRKKNIIRVYHAQNASDGGKNRRKPASPERRRPAPGTRPEGASDPARSGTARRPASRIAAPDTGKPVRRTAASTAGTASETERRTVRTPADAVPTSDRVAAAEETVGISAAVTPGTAGTNTRTETISRTKSAVKPEDSMTVKTVEKAGASSGTGTAEKAGASSGAETTGKAGTASGTGAAESIDVTSVQKTVRKTSSESGSKTIEGSDVDASAETADEKQKAAAGRPAEPSTGQKTIKLETSSGSRGLDRTASSAARRSDPAASQDSRRSAAGRTSGGRRDGVDTVSPGGVHSGDRRLGDRPGQSPRQSAGQGRGFRTGEGASRQGRPGQDGSRTGFRPGTAGQGAAGGGRFGQGSRSTGAGGRTESRPGAQGSRPGSRPGQTRRPGEGFAAELSKSGKDSRRDRERENKNHKKEYDKTGTSTGRRQNQNSSRSIDRRTRPGGKPAPVAKPVQEVKKPEIKEITIPEKLTIRELAEAMKMQPSVIVKKLFLQGEMVTVNQEIDFEKAQEIALEYEIIAEKEVQVDVIEELLKEEEENEADLQPRPPVVCVMGHVDHGKTSLLDYIRNTHVTRGEAGGITQHIGAYVVDIHGQKITFLDTPGHEAFTAMRMRGANATDIAVLVVAADDGVMPQTIEAISHAKAAGVEIIVAINKIDKQGANIDRVKQELSEHELVPEDWGGQTPCVPVSAHTGEGIEDLLEMILLTAEVSELKANPNRSVRGLVIEAKLDKGKGPVATILVQKGTLHQGDFIAAGACSGKVRAMMDDKGDRMKEAGPSTPVEILGLNDVPNAGEVLMSFDNDKEAKAFAETFVAENKKHLLEETKGKLSLDNLFDQIQASDLKELPIIVKADVQGSVEAVKNSLVKLSNDEVVVKVIHGGVGLINESDVTLAATSNAIIIGFNVRPDNMAKQLAEQEGVDLRLYKVIYQAIEDVEAAMKGMLDPVFEEKVIGHAQVRQLFKASGVGTIAGSYVLDGVFQRNCKVRITREGEQIYEGELASLKRFKDDVKEVRAGYECGLVFQDFNDLQEDDLIEAYIMVEVPR